MSISQERISRRRHAAEITPARLLDLCAWPFKRYVAIGDSATEGLDGPVPRRQRLSRLGRSPGPAAGAPQRPGARSTPTSRCAASSRARSARSSSTAALALEPDLSTVVAGLNDTLRRHCDLDVMAGHLDEMIGALAGQGATVLTMAFPDPVPINPLARVARARVFAYNEAIREIASATARSSWTSSATAAPPTGACGTPTACTPTRSATSASPRRSPRARPRRCDGASGRSRCRRRRACLRTGRGRVRGLDGQALRPLAD